MRTKYARRQVLIVDDETAIVDSLSEYLASEGFGVEHAIEGVAGLEKAAAGDFAVILLDLNLPDVSGIEVFRRLRRTSDVPVIMVTSRGAEIDRIVGLELGADDYVAKPFSPREVVARINNVVRRSTPVSLAQRSGQAAVAEAVGLRIDRDAHRVTLDGARVALTPTEFRILDTFERRRDHVFSRARLLNALFGVEADIYDRTLDRHIANLRKKLRETPDEPRFIETVIGIGYRFIG